MMEGGEGSLGVHFGAGFTNMHQQLEGNMQNDS